MDAARQRLLRDALQPFLVRNDARAYGAVVVDASLYLVTASLAVVVEPIWLKGLLSLAAGMITATLFVLGHDASHGALVSRRWQNLILARLLFFPSLHNHTLWRIQHNRLHHQLPNVRGHNSWSPLSLSEYRAQPASRRFLERLYRGGGFGLYYLVERWWKDKFIPLGDAPRDIRPAAWLDFAALLAWLCAWVAWLVWLATVYGHASAASAVFWGVILPYVVWNASMGLTVFLQHTHPAVPWFRTEDEARDHGGQEAVTIQVRYPRWYGLLSHDIMEHPAHHINPLIPFYRLHDAQSHLAAILGADSIAETFGPRYLLSLMRRCKLYDYDRHEWQDFSGRSTSQAEGGLAVARGAH